MEVKINDRSNTTFSTTASEDSPTSQSHSSPKLWTATQPHAVIKSEEFGVQLELGELWTYRELLYFLTLRDLKVRYKQTFMGVVWVVIQPLLTMMVLTLIFTRFVRIESHSLPYPLFAFSGLVLWLFFANAITNSTNSLINNTDLITKVYFPRMFIPAASVGAGLVDLSVASLLVIPLALYYGVAASWSLLLVPLFIALIAMLAFAVGLLFSALTVRYRDLRHALPFVIQVWMFSSPVIYPAGVVPANWRWLLTINPVAGIIEGFRDALSGQVIDWLHVAVSAVITTLLLILAVYIFRRMESSFADVI